MDLELSSATLNAVEIVPVAGRIGAELRGVRLSGAMSDREIQQIHEALLKHKVVFFRDQFQFDDATHEAFTERFGKPIKHPHAPAAEGSKFLLELGTTEGYSASRWHTDMTFMAAYPAASILRPLVLPEFGGDTMWANGATAYEDLPPPLRRMVDELDGLHRSEVDWDGHYDDDMKDKLKPNNETLRANTFETVHPMVRVHPVTGERSLILGEWFKRIVGFTSADSRRLYDILQDRMTAPENTVRWRWRLGDVAIWDNRSTQHRVAADFGEQARRMRRSTIHGDVPRGVDGRLSRQLRPQPQN